MTEAVDAYGLSELADVRDGFALTFRVRKLETTIEKIRWHGGACGRIQEDRGLHQRTVYLRDPDGNLIELIDFGLNKSNS